MRVTGNQKDKPKCICGFKSLWKSSLCKVTWIWNSRNPGLETPTWETPPPPSQTPNWKEAEWHRNGCLFRVPQINGKRKGAICASEIGKRPASHSIRRYRQAKPKRWLAWRRKGSVCVPFRWFEHHLVMLKVLGSLKHGLHRVLLED